MAEKSPTHGCLSKKKDPSLELVDKLLRARFLLTCQIKSPDNFLSYRGLFLV